MEINGSVRKITSAIDLLEGMMETKDLVLGKARFEDWEAMYRNVWSHPETARYMYWNITTSEDAAKERMQRTISYQKTHDTYLVYEKKSGQAIGFAGVEMIAPHIYQEAGIALGPDYVGKGFGKQILQVLLEYCADTLDGEEFYYSTRAQNAASKALAKSCGFSYRRSEEKVDRKTGETYELETYSKKL